MSATLPTAPTSIPRGKPPLIGLDYEALRTEAVRLTQEMSGTIWTDYNYSDPGVTILEQLCYALTELSYRATLPVAELLADPTTGRVAPRRQGLVPAPSILPCNPVTAADFRRLILDRVPEAANVWFTPAPASQTGGVAALYDVTVLLPERDPCTPGRDAHAVLQRISAYYNRHRALGEDINSLTALRPLTTRVHADVQLADGADSAVVLAELLFRLALTFAPEPKRTSLGDMLALGLSTADIFTGPLMLRGFIPASELTAQPQTIAVDTLLRQMSETGGVLTVTALTVELQDTAQPFRPGDIISFPPGRIGALCTAAGETGFSIRLFHGTARCTPAPAAVRRQLAQLWAAQRQTYPLWAQYAAYFHLAPVTPRDLSAYSSVQEQFPNIYGINSYGLPSTAGAARRGQARQLKGYLMVFDQLMADYFAQLAFLRDLFTSRAGGDQTYAWASLAPIVPDCAPLLSADYLPGLARLAGRNQSKYPRQRAIIDLLLSFYASTLPAARAAACKTAAPDPRTGLAAAQYLLRRIVPATRDRGRGFDYAAQGPVRGQPGLLPRVRAALAALGNGRPVADGPRFGRPLPGLTAEALTRQFVPVGNAANRTLLEEQETASPLTGYSVAPNLLAALTDITRYHIGWLEEKAGQVCLICQDMSGHWWLVGTYMDAMSALAACPPLVRAASGHPGTEPINFVEWVLLRAALVPGGAPTPYNFRVSAVLEDHPETPTWRRQTHATLRDNLPAHLALDCIYLAPPALHRFHQLYDAWCSALRHSNPAQRAYTARHLQDFLQARSSAPPAITANGSNPS